MKKKHKKLKDNLASLAGYNYEGYEIPSKDCNGTVITTHTLRRWKKKVNKLGYLTSEELRPAVENLRRDILKVLKYFGD